MKSPKNLHLNLSEKLGNPESQKVGIHPALKVLEPKLNYLSKQRHSAGRFIRRLVTSVFFLSWSCRPLPFSISDLLRDCMEEDFSALRPMPRTLPVLNSKYPMHTVESSSRIKDKAGNQGGITFSLEESASEATAQAELEVLRAIILRESYLDRLKNVVRTIAKKFKPEIADVLDLLRQASIGVIDAIQSWRMIRKDANAAFIWNGVHYLLKMPSDLDFLADYVAVQRWMGFPLLRNPFCIPQAMELYEGNSLVDSSALLSPQHLKATGSTQTVEGFAVGGSPSNIFDARFMTTDAAGEVKPKKPKRVREKKGDWRSNPMTEMQSFVVNEDMQRIRNAERIILSAESQFGRYSRDPKGQLVPHLQALTRKAALELQKDQKRPLSQPSESSLIYAPHALRSGVGLADTAWTPDITAQGKQDVDADDLALTSASSAAIANIGIQIEIKNPLTNTTTILQPQKELAEHASSAIYNDMKMLDSNHHINNRMRGLTRLGGELQAQTQAGSESRRRRPIKPSVSSSMDFQRTRKMQQLEERLQAIQALKAELSLDSPSSSSKHNNNRATKASLDKHTHVLRSVLSGQALGVSKEVASQQATYASKTLSALPQGTSLHIDQYKLSSDNSTGTLTAHDVVRGVYTEYVCCVMCTYESLRLRFLRASDFRCFISLRSMSCRATQSVGPSCEERGSGRHANRTRSLLRQSRCGAPGRCEQSR